MLPIGGATSLIQNVLEPPRGSTPKRLQRSPRISQQSQGYIFVWLSCWYRARLEGREVMTGSPVIKGEWNEFVDTAHQ